MIVRLRGAGGRTSISSRAILAMKVRSAVDTVVLSQDEGGSAQFQRPEFITWRLVPDDKIRYSDKAVVTTQDPELLLHRVVTSHPTSSLGDFGSSRSERPWASDLGGDVCSIRPRRSDARLRHRRSNRVTRPNHQRCLSYEESKMRWSYTDRRSVAVEVCSTVGVGESPKWNVAFHFNFGEICSPT